MFLPRSRSIVLLTLYVACAGAAGVLQGPQGPVVITGATGKTGALAYNLARSRGISVRAFVRDVNKARQVLGCDRCDESEGIFVGDLSEPATLDAPMKDAAALVIATSALPTCNPFPNCTYPAGGSPYEVDWIGAKAQLEAFAYATSGKGTVVLISTMGTTKPEQGDLFEYISFYKLNFETVLASSGLPFTIIKPCGLEDDPPAEAELVVGHDDELKESSISRGDLARAVVAALQAPIASAGLRFDLCSHKDGIPTPDEGLVKLFAAARYPWQRSPKEPASAAMNTVIV